MRSLRFIAPAAILALTTAVAEAHTGHGATNAFAAGFGHPLGGLDHLLAMVAVGLWAGLAGGRALWLWPVSFVGAMLLGGALGMAGMPMPFVEQGIVASVVVLGLAAALAFSPSVAAGGAIVALAGLFHGHAHGTEVPADASGLAYAAGFAFATALLHGAGIATTVAAARLSLSVAARAAGGLTAIAGVVLAARAFM
ncbi:MAG: HupE/UreJ family protein [Phreatobacter sp.]|uniref:HupE/UreJ family protein n=1 Tax=Phreatobacter sp. TaxID=1966341 RepID=UPI001A45F539|nr:HupE/UreJ family protein [Phreatobacter sp.]MBL8569749.1 HupE/UreJ family protein [Phreatobacter sp.]